MAQPLSSLGCRQRPLSGDGKPSSMSEMVKGYGCARRTKANPRATGDVYGDFDLQPMSGVARL